MGCRKSRSMKVIIWPLALLIVIENQVRIENCDRSNRNGNVVSDSLSGILGFKRRCSEWNPLAMFSSTVLLLQLGTMHLVPFISYGGLPDQSIISDIQSFSSKIYDGSSDTSIEFKQSAGKWMACSSLLLH